MSASRSGTIQSAKIWARSLHNDDGWAPAPGPAIEYGSALLSYRSHIKIVSDGYRDGVVFEDSAVYSCSPDSGWILKSAPFVAGPKLDRVAAGFARILIPGKRLFYAGRSREGAR